jgi:hypothetical protein
MVLTVPACLPEQSGRFAWREIAEKSPTRYYQELMRQAKARMGPHRSKKCGFACWSTFVTGNCCVPGGPAPESPAWAPVVDAIDQSLFVPGPGDACTFFFCVTGR